MESSGKDVVLLCEGCGERIVLGGPLSVWNGGSTSFACGCGAQLTLSHQLDPLEADERNETMRRYFQREVDGTDSDPDLPNQAPPAYHPP